MIDRTEMMRQMIEMAITYGRKQLSPQTGYLHYCYSLHEDDPHLPIPVIDNFLFALALLRSRQIENVNEAKVLLEGLLHFQNKQAESIADGNFPIYLHEYPICKDRFIGVQVAAVIYWILKLYHQGLGSELKKRLEDAFIAALHHVLRAQAEKPAPYPMAVKIAATVKAGGKLLQNHDLIKQGTDLLIHLNQNQNDAAWYCPKSMGIMLSALMMVYPRLSESPWANFWKHLESTWHRRTCSYVGPALKEWQQGSEPQVTLYDLAMGYFSKQMSERALKIAPVHLEAMLLPLCDDTLHDLSYPLVMDGLLGESPWRLYHDVHSAYCIIEAKPEFINQADEKGFHVFKLVWGDHHRVHTFVGQGGNNLLSKYNTDDGVLSLSFELGELGDLEEREKCREVIFFMDHHEKLEFLIAGAKSSIFSLGEEISIKDDSCQLSLTFALEEGDGTFMGHRMLGNRPAQLDVKRKHRYDAYDWQLFLRTVRRTAQCRMNVTLRLNKI